MKSLPDYPRVKIAMAFRSTSSGKSSLASITQRFFVLFDASGKFTINPEKPLARKTEVNKLLADVGLGYK